MIDSQSTASRHRYDANGVQVIACSHKIRPGGTRAPKLKISSDTAAPMLKLGSWSLDGAHSGVVKGMDSLRDFVAGRIEALL